MPSATTICIVNLQPTEAKVEAIFESFVSLREEVMQGGANAGATDNFFMYDDDDGNYQVPLFDFLGTESRLFYEHRFKFHLHKYLWEWF